MHLHHRRITVLAGLLFGISPSYADSYLINSAIDDTPGTVLLAGAVISRDGCSALSGCVAYSSDTFQLGSAGAISRMSLMAIGIQRAGSVVVNQHSALNFVPAYGQASVGYTATGNLAITGSSAVNGLAGITAGEGLVHGNIFIDDDSIIRFSGVRGATIGDRGSGRLVVSRRSAIENINGLTVGEQAGSSGEVVVTSGSLVAFKSGSGVTIGYQGAGSLTLSGRSRIDGAGTVVVGSRATGALTLSSYSSIENMGSLILGEEIHGSGSAYLTSGRITMRPSSALTVGLAGSGMLQLSSGSELDASDAVIQAGVHAGALGDIVNRSSIRAARLELGSMSGGTGGYEQTDGRLILDGGSGPTVLVTQGIFSVNGSFALTARSGTPGVTAALAAMVGPTTRGSQAKLQGRADLTVDSRWGSTDLGPSPAWVVARQVDVGARRVTQLAEGRVGLGNLSVKLDAPQDGRHWSPEILRTGCGNFSSGLGDCSVEILSARSVAYASKVLSGAGSLPDLHKSDAMTSAAILDRSQTFIKDKRTLVGVDLSARVYQQGGPRTLQREIASLDLDGLRAYAYETSYGAGSGDITVVIRGTEFSDGRNWAANAGFSGIRNGTQLAYLQNLGMLTASIATANPNAQIRFVGHSLGGGLAMILGAYYGKDAYSYNGPVVSPVLGDLAYYENYLPGIDGWSRKREGDWSNLFNIRSAHDPVSAGTNLLGALGYTVTVAPNAIEYFLSTPDNPGILSRLGDETKDALIILRRNFALSAAKALVVIGGNEILTQINVAHSISNLRGQLYDPKNMVIDVSYNGVSQASQDWSLDPELLEQAVRDRVFMPDSTVQGDFFSNVFDRRNVLSGVKYFLDPAYEDAYVFTASEESPNFAMVQVPFLNVEKLVYLIQVLQGDDWVPVASLLPEDDFYFDEGGVKTFRLVLQGDSQPKMELQGSFFGVAFSSDGVFSGSIASVTSNVTEPTCIAMTCAALAVAWLVPRKNRPKFAA